MRCLSCFSLLSFCALTAAADPLFEDHALLHVTITAPIEDVRRERDSGEYFAGRFGYTDSDGNEHELDIKLRARGQYRRQTRTCQFPPIRLNFRKGQVRDTLFHKQDKLKLVAHCRTGNKRYEQFALREYVLYRLFNEMTDYSFRVRLLRIRWVDTDPDEKPFEHYGFLIEDEDRLAKRLGIEPARVPRLRPDNLVPAQALRVAVFQYMIGNTDFSMIAGRLDDDCCHNTVPFRTDNGLLPIPYDFDFAGAVEAPYATPNPELGITSVKKRLYRGRCEWNDRLDDTLAAYREKGPTVRELIDTQEGLDDRTRKRMSRYISDFFRDINDPRRIERYIVKKCR